LLESGKVNVLTLIGSSKVADHLKKMHPKVNRLRAILGLDAKNAAIVFPDADLDLAVRECLLGSLSFNGQRCTALKMLIVHRSIVEAFLQSFTEQLAKLKVGMPWDMDVSITPLPELGKVSHMTKMVEDAKSKGARVVKRGWWHVRRYPVLSGCRLPGLGRYVLYREEQFGPIVPVMPFEDTGHRTGLTSSRPNMVSRFRSSARTRKSSAGWSIRWSTRFCRVNINCQCQRGPDVFPLYGPKDSAEGTLSVNDALRSFSIRSMIAAKQGDSSKRLLEDIVNTHKSNFINTGFIL